eukprot:3473529-Pyramimonas_sp.AAC.1
MASSAPEHWARASPATFRMFALGRAPRAPQKPKRHALGEWRCQGTARQDGARGPADFALPVGPRAVSVLQESDCLEIH